MECGPAVAGSPLLNRDDRSSRSKRSPPAAAPPKHSLRPSHRPPDIHSQAGLSRTAAARWYRLPACPLRCPGRESSPATGSKRWIQSDFGTRRHLALLVRDDRSSRWRPGHSSAPDFFDVITCNFMSFTGFFESAVCHFMLFWGVFVVFRPRLSSLGPLPSLHLEQLGSSRAEARWWAGQ